MRAAAILTILLFAAPGPARAAFEDLGAGARAPGMGGAFAAIADDVYAIHYNPAGLGTLERMQLGLSHSRLYMGLSDGSTLGLSHFALARPLREGRWGAAGVSWRNFSASGLYSENTLGLSYGRLMLRRASRGRLYGGLNAKLLRRSFDPGPEGSDALSDTFKATGKPDPALSGGGGGGMDFDVGLLYRTPRRYSLALAVQHLNEPDVGFASSDKLGRKIRLGAAYKCLWMNLAAEVAMSKSPTGSADRDIVVAGERFFPTLDFGQFGVRGSLGAGSRQFRRLTFGLSYRINKIQMDYAVQLPISGIQGTMGTHRLGMTFYFGAPTPEEQYSEELLSQYSRLRARAEGMGYEAEDVSEPARLDDPALRPVMAKIAAGQYREANRLLLRFMDELPPRPALFHLARRLELVANPYPELIKPKQKWEVVASSGMRAFLAGGDREAALLIAYASSLNTREFGLEKLGGKVAELTHTEVPRPAQGRNLWVELHAKMDEAFRAGKYDAALGYSLDALVLEPRDLRSLKRVGTNHYMLGHYDEAVAVWRGALGIEKDGGEQEILKTYIQRALSAKAGRLPPFAKPRPRPAAKPRVSAPPPKKRRRRKKPSAGRPDPREIERLYQAGLEHYSRNDIVQATVKFRQILRMDPENVPARKALERIRRRPR